MNFFLLRKLIGLPSASLSSIDGCLGFPSLLAAIDSSLTRTAGYSLSTSHKSSFDKQNKSEYPTLLTLAVRLLPLPPSL